jgi:hypothetical protein
MQQDASLASGARRWRGSLGRAFDLAVRPAFMARTEAEAEAGAGQGSHSRSGSKAEEGRGEGEPRAGKGDEVAALRLRWLWAVALVESRAYGIKVMPLCRGRLRDCFSAWCVPVCACCP